MNSADWTAWMWVAYCTLLAVASLGIGVVVGKLMARLTSREERP